MKVSPFGKPAAAARRVQRSPARPSPRSALGSAVGLAPGQQARQLLSARAVLAGAGRSPVRVRSLPSGRGRCGAARSLAWRCRVWWSTWRVSRSISASRVACVGSLCSSCCSPAADGVGQSAAAVAGPPRQRFELARVCCRALCSASRSVRSCSRSAWRCSSCWTAWACSTGRGRACRRWHFAATRSRPAARSASRCCSRAALAAWVRACSSAVWAASCAPLRRERGLEHPHRLFLRVVTASRGPRVAVAVVVVVLGGGVGGDVGVVAVPAAAHRDVQVLAVHAGPDQHDPDVGGGALGGVDGGRPAVLGVFGQVGGRQHGPAPAGRVLPRSGRPAVRGRGPGSGRRCGHGRRRRVSRRSLRRARSTSPACHPGHRPR